MDRIRSGKSASVRVTERIVRQQGGGQGERAEVPVWAGW